MTDKSKCITRLFRIVNFNRIFMRIILLFIYLSLLLQSALSLSLLRLLYETLSNILTLNSQLHYIWIKVVTYIFNLKPHNFYPFYFKCRFYVLRFLNGFDKDDTFLIGAPSYKTNSYILIIYTNVVHTCDLIKTLSCILMRCDQSVT